jgi:hypothetical protein
MVPYPSRKGGYHPRGQGGVGHAFSGSKNVDCVNIPKIDYTMLSANTFYATLVGVDSSINESGIFSAANLPLNV